MGRPSRKVLFRPVLIVMGLALPLAACGGGGSPGLSQPSAPFAATPSSGGAILSGLDAGDRQKADTARQEALERAAAGTAVTWKSAESTGRYGSVVAGPSFIQAGQSCRQFTQTIYIEGVPQTARSSACRQADGNWRVS
jgi:surface antigen